MPCSPKTLLAAALTLPLLASAALRGEDWPQWRGTNREGVCGETGLLQSFPPGGFKDADKGDYSALVKIGIDKAGVMFVEADLQRRPTPQIVADGVEMVRQFKPDGFAIEVNQFQELLCADFLRVGQQTRTHLPIFEINNQVNKNVRIRRLGPHLSQRKLRFKTRSPGTALLVQQLKDFPVGDHDDGPDALEQGIRLLIELWNGQAPRPVERIVVQ